MQGDDDNPYRSPTSAVAEMHGVQAMVDAGKWRRFFNLLLDYVAVMLVVFVLTVLAVVVGGDEAVAWIDTMGIWKEQLLGVGMMVAYYTVMEGLFGLTIGKWITGTRVVDEAGGPPSWRQALLRSLGVADADWLEAVRCHHHRGPGPLAKKTPAQQMARLLQRADIFGARMAPRAARWPMPVTAAMQASYYDEEHQVDEAGAALVKTLGVYPPGAFVRLASQEVGVVIRRGTTATTPRVAVVTNREGMPTGEPIPRDTGMPPWKVTGVVAFKDVRVKLSLERLLQFG